MDDTTLPFVHRGDYCKIFQTCGSPDPDQCLACREFVPIFKNVDPQRSLLLKKGSTQGRVEMKRCSQCGGRFPRTEDFFFQRPGTSDGLAYVCKACQGVNSRNSARRRTAQKKEQKKEARVENMKTCKRCGKSFPATSEYFGPKKKTRDGLNYWCRSCANKVTREWARKNRAKKKAADLAAAEKKAAAAVEKEGGNSAADAAVLASQKKDGAGLTLEKVRAHDRRILTVDFNGSEELFEYLEKWAENDFRTVDAQIKYLISRHKTGRVCNFNPGVNR